MRTNHAITISAPDAIAAIMEAAEKYLHEQGLSNMTINTSSLRFIMKTGGDLQYIDAELEIKEKEETSLSNLAI